MVDPEGETHTIPRTNNKIEWIDRSYFRITDEKGVEYTKTIIATKGRASYLGERSLGHQDPGATSFTTMLKVVAEKM